MRHEPESGSYLTETRALFERVLVFVQRFVTLGESEVIAVTLWILMTHAVDLFDCVPYLSITSAEKQSGKTRLLEVLSLLVYHPWMTGRTTPAVLVRKIDKEHPTLLLDESDATFRGDKEFAETLRGVLNTGYLRSGKTSLCVLGGKSIDYVDLSTFGPKAIAGIGDLPDTVADRSVPIRLKRKLPGERVERFRRRHVEAEANALLSEITAWAEAIGDGETWEPAGLEALPDRAADICEPLLMLAEAAGAEIASITHIALVSLCGIGREDDSLGVRLLGDTRDVFSETAVDRIPSEQLAKALAAIEESPWGPRFGRDFDARALARQLRPFGIRPRTVRLDSGKTPKGYHADDFSDAWARFLPPPEKPPQPPQTQHCGNDARSELAVATRMRASNLGGSPGSVDVQPEEPHQSRLVAHVAGVAASTGMLDEPEPLALFEA